MSHTPLPWVVEYDQSGGYDMMSEGYHIRAPLVRSDEDNDLITTIDVGYYDGIYQTPGGKSAARANAEFIVRCVNSHDDLVEALERLVSKPAPFCEDKFGGSVCPYCDCTEHLDDCDWLQAQQAWVDIKNK